jgi:hypothetical protein
MDKFPELKIDDLMFRLQQNLFTMTRFRFAIIQTDSQEEKDKYRSKIEELERRNSTINLEIESYHNKKLEPVKHFLRNRSMPSRRYR